MSLESAARRLCTRPRAAGRLVRLLALAAALVACGDDGVAPPAGPDTVGVRVSADLSGTAVATVQVEVVADTFAPEIFTLTVAADTVSQCVDVPVGLSLDVTLRALDAGETETHSGTLALTVQAGERVMGALTLEPVGAGSSVEAILHSVALGVAPREDTLEAGRTLQLAGRLLDCEGTAVTGALTWDTSDPTVATVSAAGLVSAVDTGSAEITVTHGLLADSAEITVVPATGVALELVESGLSGALFVTAPPGDTSRLFVVQRTGLIRILQADTLVTQPFLNISGLVRTTGGEQGLLGMAFHPSYATNGFFFVNYTNLNGDTRVVRYEVSGDPNVADATSGDTILSVDQPFANHNAGMLAFGPDGMLYVGLGDGGSGGDPDERAQNLGELLGKMLRINVNGALPYEIPPDNPFAGMSGARGEIWAYGLRNPWRYAFDRETGDLYIADVGQNAWEEVSVQPASSTGGENYGWDIMEGMHCHEPASGCDMTGLVLPLVEYPHPEGCSITGGYVYRGSRVTALSGHYLYADFCAGFVRSFRYAGGAVTDERDWSAELAALDNVSSFGEDAGGELYITTLNGNVYRIVPAGP